MGQQPLGDLPQFRCQCKEHPPGMGSKEKKETSVPSKHKLFEKERHCFTKNIWEVGIQ